jgi:predicted Zn-dependent protease with MMP-like domain
MNVSRKQFEEWVKEVIDSLPEKYLQHLNNVAFFVEDCPSQDQIRKVKLGKGLVLFGLYEGYHQSSRKNIGVVMPDRITIFRKSIAGYYNDVALVKKQIENTIKHEIAHHFGSNEPGARKAGSRKI